MAEISIEPFDRAKHQRAAALSKSLGVFAVEVLAIDEQAAAFYVKYGFMRLLDDPKHLFLPMSEIEAAIA